MARDYKHRATSRKRRKPVSPWLGMTVGLLVGLFVAFLVYIKMLAPKTPGLANGLDAGMAETAPSAGNGVADAGSKQPPKPRFVFYTELPEMEVIVPEEEIRQRASQPPPVVTDKPAVTSQPAARPETYYLQAGSFKGADQADRFKAKLALMGFETDIQTITINNRDTYHRVRVGPFSNLGALDRARNRLKQEGIETRTVKIKG
jgi:cell division protein FtsN